MIEFIVPGIPRPGGSKRHVGHGILIDAGVHTKEWRALVSQCAELAMMGQSQLLDGPLELRVTFRMLRPKKHYNSKGSLRSDAPKYHTGKPDTTKLIRAIEDAMTGIVWIDDSRVAIQHSLKIYHEKPGAVVSVEEIQNAEK